MLVALITAVAMVATVALLARDARSLKQSGEERLRGRIVPTLLFFAFQAFIGVYAAIGMVESDLLSAVVFNAVFSAGAYLGFHRELVVDRLRALTSEHGRFPHPFAATLIALALAGACATLALEIPSNHNLLWMYPLCLMLEWAIVTLLIAAFFFISQRRAGLPAFIAFFFWAVGIAEHFVITFKSMPIAPGDLSALSTAMAVAGTGYSYILTPFCLYGLAFMGLSVFLSRAAALLAPDRSGLPRKVRVRTVIAGILCLVCVGAHVTMIDYYHTLNIQVYTWRPLESYYRQGFLPSFISGAQTIKPPVPKGYNIGTAKDLTSEYAARFDESEGASVERAQAVAQFEEKKPAIVTIMNETFSDLSIYQNLHSGYQGPQFYKSLSDTLQRGTLYVSAYGGGTCNTEWEYLSGNSMAFLGSGVYPYTIYDLTRSASLSEQFRDMGYKTTAIHPNHGTNWNRENVYRDFGFDQFLTIQDFQDAEKLRGMVTDDATYDRIIEMLEQDDSPQFIFDVTMQNHSGYDTGMLPLDKQVDYPIDGVSDPEVNEYLALIEESDRALEEFIGKLRELDRPVVLVFFGDHQPFFPDEFNEAWFPGEDPAVHAERLWQTDYIIWANYDVAGRDQESRVDDLSTNYLGSVMMDLIGAPMTDWQKAHISLRAALPAINSTGYEDADGRWYLSSMAAHPEEFPKDGAGAAATTARGDYAMMQYFELFRDGKNIYTKNFQSAANETDPNLAPGTTQIK